MRNADETRSKAARDHLASLVRSGLDEDYLAKATGINRRRLARIVHGRVHHGRTVPIKWIKREEAEAIFRIEVEQ
jgi:hypothetical protein